MKQKKVFWFGFATNDNDLLDDQHYIIKIRRMWDGIFKLVLIFDVKNKWKDNKRRRNKVIKKNKNEINWRNQGNIFSLGVHVFFVGLDYIEHVYVMKKKWWNWGGTIEIYMFKGLAFVRWFTNVDWFWLIPVKKINWTHPLTICTYQIIV